MGIKVSKFQTIQLEQIDQVLAEWRSISLRRRPALGWVHSIRSALGMTAVAFARRLGMTHAGILKLEKSEVDESISLASLRKLAQALDCDLEYALIPRIPLKQYLEDRAMELAREQLMPLTHTMSLEDQSTTPAMKQLQLELIAKEILDGSRRDMW
jgi:predicted DNA-binding mobile mystery protein A